MPLNSKNDSFGARVVVTGGAGEMAAYACRVLAEAPEIGCVVIADRDADKAAALAAALGPKASPQSLDVADREALIAAVSDADVVLNCAGPFYRFGREVLSTAIETRTDYLDICDDWEPTLEMLELDDAAREAGVTAIIGMGASPGTSNLLAALAMQECDTVETVYTAWRAGGLPRPTAEQPVPQSTAAIEHWVHNCTEPIKIWRGGRLVDAYALEERTLRYPGWAEDAVWVCGHPEPLTLPRVRPEVKESLNLMTARRGLMDAIGRIAERVRSGELTVPAASQALLLEPATAGSAAGPAPRLPVLFAVAEGVKGGQPVRVGAQPLVLPNRNMGEMTGIPLAVATLMLLRGEFKSPGVQGPEGAIPPEGYFEHLARLASEQRPDGRVYELVSEPR